MNEISWESCSLRWEPRNWMLYSLFEIIKWPSRNANMWNIVGAETTRGILPARLKPRWFDTLNGYLRASWLHAGFCQQLIRTSRTRLWMAQWFKKNKKKVLIWSLPLRISFSKNVPTLSEDILKNARNKLNPFGVIMIAKWNIFKFKAFCLAKCRIVKREDGRKVCLEIDL